MNAIDIALLASLAVAVFFVVRHLRRKPSGCGCGCEACPMSDECKNKTTQK